MLGDISNSNNCRPNEKKSGPDNEDQNHLLV